MDEPFSALDLRNRARLQSFMKTFLEDTEMTSVIVTHSIEEALRMGDRVAVFDPERGRIRKIREGCRREADPDPAMLDECSRRIRESLLQME
jgi:ABC-type nitrate/sulfonate/bicarbonate transport system ATPase subunit